MAAYVTPATCGCSTDNNIHEPPYCHGRHCLILRAWYGRNTHPQSITYREATRTLKSQALNIPPFPVAIPSFLLFLSSSHPAIPFFLAAINPPPHVQAGTMAAPSFVPSCYVTHTQQGAQASSWLRRNPTPQPKIAGSISPVAVFHA